MSWFSSATNSLFGGNSSSMSSSGFLGSSCVSKNSSGLNSYCYNTGFDHGSPSSLGSDPVGDALGAFPCTLKVDANQCYAQGYSDSMSLKKK